MSTASVSIIAIFFGLRYGLKPLDILRRQVAARGADDLSPLADAGLPQELRPIAAGMSALLARLDAVVTENGVRLFGGL